MSIDSIFEDYNKRLLETKYGQKLDDEDIRDIGVFKDNDECRFYEEFCKSSNIRVESYMTKALTYSNVTGELNFTGMPLSIEQLTGIAYVLQKSHKICSLNFSDCMVLPNGISVIFDSLLNNKYVTDFNLYGNNLSEGNTAKLGKLLLVNKTIKSLNMKWNNVGLFPTAFAVFCEGLAQNTSVETLDLRSNQLNPDSAISLATALKMNRTLEELDLRWNRIRSEGAESLLKGIEHNRTIRAVHLKGNFIRREIAMAIEVCLKSHNKIRETTKSTKAENDVLKNQLETLKKSNSDTISNVLEESEKRYQEAEVLIAQLKRDLALEHQKMTELETQLINSERKNKEKELRVKEMNEEIEAMKETMKTGAEANWRTIEELKKENHQIELKLLSQLSQLEKKLLVEQQTSEKLRDDLSREKEVTNKYKEKLNYVKTHYDEDTAYKLETLEAEKKMWQKKYTEMKQAMETDLDKLSQAVRDQQNKYEMKIIEITEKETSKLMSVLEKLDEMKDAKAELEEEKTTLEHKMCLIQKENSALISHMAEPAKKLSTLFDELSLAKSDIQQLEKTQMEDKRLISQLKTELSESRLREASKEFEEEIQQKHEKETASLRKKLETIKKKLEKKVKTISNMRNEEKERLRLLYSALANYLESSRPSSTTSVSE